MTDVDHDRNTPLARELLASREMHEEAERLLALAQQRCDALARAYIASDDSLAALALKHETLIERLRRVRKEGYGDVTLFYAVDDILAEHDEQEEVMPSDPPRDSATPPLVASGGEGLDDHGADGVEPGMSCGLDVQPDYSPAREERRWRMALQSLTPGGSEYAYDPEACARFVREARASLHRLLKRFKRERDEERRRYAGLASEILDAFDGDTAANVPGVEHLARELEETRAAHAETLRTGERYITRALRAERDRAELGELLAEVMSDTLDGSIAMSNSLVERIKEWTDGPRYS